jgi:hypothetical protein
MFVNLVMCDFHVVLVVFLLSGWLAITYETLWFLGLGFRGVAFLDFSDRVAGFRGVF